MRTFSLWFVALPWAVFGGVQLGVRMSLFGCTNDAELGIVCVSPGSQIISIISMLVAGFDTLLLAAWALERSINRLRSRLDRRGPLR